MRISDWSSDVCSSDLRGAVVVVMVVVSHADQHIALPQRAGGVRREGGGEGGADACQGGAEKCCAGCRSEERSVGKECVSTCRCRGAQEHYKKNTKQKRCTDQEDKTRIWIKSKP